MRPQALLLVSLLALGASLAPPGASAQESCLTCHAALLQGKNAHPPTESCDGCHEAVSQPHPHKGQKTFKLAQEPPELCTSCHEAFGKKAQVHEPVRQGQCTSCHDPHASSQPKLLAQPARELCQACHSAQVELQHLHGPVSAGDCGVCHSPHESDVKPLLLKPSEQLCFGCHVETQAALQKPHVHAALQQGCTSCHNPHGAAQPKLLAEAGPALCFQCHEAVAQKVQRSPVPHAAASGGKGCASCHSPHAADHPKLLADSEQATCLGCHKSTLTKKMTVLHGPIKEGRCTPCHDPHGSQNPKLLSQPFPADAYVPYTDAAFGLCFGCHKRDLLQYPETSFATGFRDGERNLHHLHVNNKQKGRSCTLCHSVHGSDNEPLLADSVPFGKWSLPLKFVKTATGGACSPGCHRPYSYDRQSPGKILQMPKPAGKTDS